MGDQNFPRTRGRLPRAPQQPPAEATADRFPPAGASSLGPPNHTPSALRAPGCWTRPAHPRRGPLSHLLASPALINSPLAPCNTEDFQNSFPNVSFLSLKPAFGTTARKRGSWVWKEGQSPQCFGVSATPPPDCGMGCGMGPYSTSPSEKTRRVNQDQK